jgi:mono/diheme cytochrome c family protein
MEDRRSVTIRGLCALVGAVAAAALVAGCSTSSHSMAPSDPLARGQYLASIMDCAGCHTPGALRGQPDGSRRLAGSEVGFGFPGGVVYPPNLTPDPETGLGRWSDAEIARAIRQGQSRDGRPLVPIMPWPSYSVLTEADARALVAYLRSLAPVRHAVPRRAGPGEKPTAPFLMLVEPK